jgi:polyribonucleotide nucleotidyltransferase
VDKIRDVIGPGGKMIPGIIGTDRRENRRRDDGRVIVSPPTATGPESDLDYSGADGHAELTKIYSARSANTGAFVEIMPARTACCTFQRS